MLNMPMNESCVVWPLEQILCPHELAELKTIKHKYHVWKDYSKKDNEQIVEWNTKARKVRDKEICNIIVVTKQGVPEDFWFKPYIHQYKNGV